jgi:Phage integrase family
VAVWTTAKVAQFLQHVATDELFALWWLVALRGLRRGEAAGLRWCDVDLDYHPNYFTKRLRYLIDKAGLPPVRLHDLRHGAASLAHAAGADLKTVQDQLGHASNGFTADTYTSVLPAAQHKAAEATARLILTTARAARATMTGRHRPDGPPAPAADGHAPCTPTTSAQQAPTVHNGAESATKSQLRRRAAGDSNPEPKD